MKKKNHFKDQHGRSVKDIVIETLVSFLILAVFLYFTFDILGL